MSYLIDIRWTSLPSLRQASGIDLFLRHAAKRPPQPQRRAGSYYLNFYLLVLLLLGSLAPAVGLLLVTRT